MLMIHILIDKYLKELSPTSKAGRYSSQGNRNTSNQGSSQPRKYRPDYMAQYPFADETGTVKEIFQHPVSASIDILSMGLPGRKKLINKVFDIMRFDRSGIRMSDLPEALEVKGLC